MSNPDKALLWVGKYWATICDEDGFPDGAWATKRRLTSES